VLYENQYFLICNSESNDGLTHFRLEMLTNVAVTDSDARNPESIPQHGENFDLGAYLRRSQNMWGGEKIQVKLRCDNYIRDVIRMRFGKHIMMIDDGPDHFTVNVEVADNTGLYQWLAERGTRLTVVSPESVRNHYLQYLRDIIDMY
jgi:predicted DNA-binding transcriptional regulator YafY